MAGHCVLHQSYPTSASSSLFFQHFARLCIILLNNLTRVLAILCQMFSGVVDLCSSCTVPSFPVLSTLVWDKLPQAAMQDMNRSLCMSLMCTVFALYRYVLFHS